MTEPAAQTPEHSNGNISGVNVLLMGPSGTGKTYSIGTLIDSGVKVFYLTFESGMESLMGYYTDSGKPIPPNFHWAKVSPPKASMADLLRNARNVNTMSYDSLSKMVDPKRGNHDQFIKGLESLNNFKSDRTGESFGDVSTWGHDCALVIDGLTGLSDAAMAAVVGGKPTKSQPEWGLAQGEVERLLQQLTNNCNCHLVLIAHVERETDPVLGGVKIMPATLGKALAPRLARLFSDVILTERGTGGKYTWNVTSTQADVKSRNLPYSENLPPKFQAIVEKWKSRMFPKK